MTNFKSRNQPSAIATLFVILTYLSSQGFFSVDRLMNDRFVVGLAGLEPDQFPVVWIGW